MSTFQSRRTRSRTTDREVSFAWQIIFGVLKLALVALVVFAVYYVTRLSVFTITDATVSGGETISHEEIQARVAEELQGTYFLIIPKRFTYLFPHDRIHEVLSKNTRMHDIQIARSNRTNLHVTFEEYIPHALWCTEEREGMQECFFMNTEGYVFAKAPMLGGDTLTQHVVEGLEEISLGVAIEPERLRSIDEFIEKSEQELGFRITSLLHKKNNDLEFTVNGGGYILVASLKDMRESFENLRSIISSPEFKHLEPGNFRYIDVRFDNKVFVNEELTPVASSTVEKAVATST